MDLAGQGFKGIKQKDPDSGLNSRGMTLIEMVIAIALTAVIFMIVGVFFTSSNVLFNQSGERAESQQVVRIAAQRISEELRNVETVSLPTSAPASGFGYYEKNNHIIRSDGGTEDEITETGIAEDGVSFSLSQENGKYYLSFTIIGTDGYTLTTKVLLNNVDSGPAGTTTHFLQFTKS